MNQVKLNRKDLLARVIANRAAHAKDYDEAVVAYAKKLEEELTKALAVLRTGGRIKQNMGLVEPLSYIKEYDSVISMLEMSVDDVIILTHMEFNQYVRDEWVWKNMAFTANSAYKSL